MLIHPWNSWKRKLFWGVFAFRCWLKVCDGSWVLEYWSNNLSHFRASRSLQMGTKEFQGWEGAWETLGTLPKEVPTSTLPLSPSLEIFLRSMKWVPMATSLTLSESRIWILIRLHSGGNISVKMICSFQRGS